MYLGMVHMEIKAVVLIIWFGMSGSSLSFECFSNGRSLNTSACMRTHRRYCSVHTQSHFPLP